MSSSCVGSEGLVVAERRDGVPAAAEPLVTVRQAARVLAAWPPMQHGAVVALLAILLFGKAATLDADSNWDLRNYHLYNPFALLHGKWSIDFLPAQMQSLHTPILDLPFYWLVGHVHSVPALNAIMAVPHVVASGLAYALAVSLLRARTGGGRVTAALAALIGLTGAATLPVLASTQSDIAAVCPILGALLLLVPGGELRPTARRVIGAGLLVGAACALKLTLAYVAIALAVGLAVSPGSVAARSRRLVLLGLGGTAGLLLTAGWWYALVWRHWGNPLFPYYNDLFRSPLAPALPFKDPMFLPPTLLRALQYPLIMATKRQMVMTEVPARDARFLVGLLAAVLLLLRGRAVSPALRLAAVTLLVGYAVWEAQFSIFRYLSGLELLIGPVLAAALVVVLPRRAARPALVNGLLAIGLIGLTAWTRYPETEHAASARPIAVDLPPFAPGTMVVLLDDSPMAYLAAYEPVGVRFVGASNNLVGLHHGPAMDGMKARVQALIDAQRGEIWGASVPRVSGTDSDLAARLYGLRRTEACFKVPSNLDYSLIRLCRMERDPAG